MLQIKDARDVNAVRNVHTLLEPWPAAASVGVHLPGAYERRVVAVSLCLACCCYTNVKVQSIWYALTVTMAYGIFGVVEDG
jgi:hypothetical protein